MNLRLMLKLTEQDINELKYQKGKLKKTLKRIENELETKERAASEIRSLIEKEENKASTYGGI
ncbi:hypothetical protein [Bacillus smithii]|uniref:hypothetical protein n=1 Tax=Bacillus smithii TaxID=1479 RepID=UPI002E1AC19F|nr:hypothetical protein [Bacillus smithii]MED4929153.1 hypothetical protein [Bacillus smithii]